MRLAYFTVSLAIIAFGAIHITATPWIFPHLTNAAIWFASGGIAIILTGALNLLRRTYGGVAPGVKFVCVGANLVMTGFSVLAGYVSRASVAQIVVVLGLLGGATLLSLVPAAQSERTAPGAA